MRNAFNPEEIAFLISVADDTARATVAVRVLACAAQGERDFAVLLSPARGSVAWEAANATQASN